MCAGSALGSPAQTPPASQQPRRGDTGKARHSRARPPSNRVTWEATAARQPRAEVEGSRPTKGPRAGEELQPPQQPSLFPRNLAEGPPASLPSVPGVLAPDMSRARASGSGTAGGRQAGGVTWGRAPWGMGRGSESRGPAQTLTLGSRRLSPNSSSQNGCLQFAKN